MKTLQDGGFASFFQNDFLAIFPEIFLLICTLFLLMYGVHLQARTTSNIKAEVGSLRGEGAKGRGAVGELKAPEGGEASLRPIHPLSGTGCNPVEPLIHPLSFTPYTATKLAPSNSEADLLLRRSPTARSEVALRPILTENVGYLSLLTLVFTLILLLHNPLNGGGAAHMRDIFGGSFILDNFTLFFKALLILSSLFILMISFDYLKKESFNAFEYHILILLSISSMLFMISSYDFLSLYLTLEFQSLCFYVLAACKRNSEFSTEAGLKYFLLGAFSSGILLFGISLIYGFTGLTNFEELTQLCTSVDITHSAGILLGILFIAVGLLFKLTAAPFHMWAPDVYEGAPTSVTAFFSVAPKIALLALFIRLFYYAGPFGAIGGGYAQDNVGLFEAAPLEHILILCSIASMCIGAFAALSQEKIKRLFAYSSIGHIGYMLIGLISGNREGLESVIIYLVIYLMMTINVFALLLSLRSQDRGSFAEGRREASPPSGPDKGYNGGFASFAFKNTEFNTYPSDFRTSTQIRFISDLSLLAKTNPLLAFTFALTLFSMAGIPPLAGFCGKFYVFFSALSSSFYILAFVGIFTSVVSCFYYIRLIKIMYFEKETQTSNNYTEIPSPSPINSFEPIDKIKSLILGFTLFFSAFFLCYPAPLFLIAHKIVLSL